MNKRMATLVESYGRPGRDLVLGVETVRDQSRICPVSAPEIVDDRRRDPYDCGGTLDDETLKRSVRAPLPAERIRPPGRLESPAIAKLSDPGEPTPFQRCADEMTGLWRRACDHTIEGLALGE